MWTLSCFVVTCLVLTTTTVSGADEVPHHKLHSSDSATDEPKLSEVCGIASGEEPPTGNFESNAWPWIVSVRIAYNKDFHCGGTLIAPQAVFTAAHCVKTEDKEEEAKDIVVYLGTTDATKTDGNHAVVSSVSNIYYYHGYRPKTLENNIALLILETPISFNEFIRPACIWPNPNVSPGFDEIVNKDGYIATWTGATGVPSVAKIVTSRSTEDRNCGNYFISSRSFCAKNTDNTTFCSEDVGQGLLYKRNGRWTLRGVLSVFSGHRDGCETASYVLYADASPMWWWLRATLRDKLGYNIET